MVKKFYLHTSVSAKASTLPKDSILVKSGPSPVITTLTKEINSIFYKQNLEQVTKITDQSKKTMINYRLN